MMFAALMAVAAQTATVDIPALNGVRPTFGFGCHAPGSGTTNTFRYFVYLPEAKPVGDRQKVIVKLVDGNPATLGKAEVLLDAQLANIVVPPPPSAKVDAVPANITRLTARSASGESLQSSLQMSMAADPVTTKSGQTEMRLKPAKGWVKVADASGKDRKLTVTCDDLSAPAAPTN